MADSLSLVLLTLVVLLYTKSCLSLYEDQVGQNDWRKSYLGKVKFSHFDVSTHSSKRLFVATENNVLAALNSRTGQIMWRIVMEETTGKIDALLHQGSFLVSISGGGKFVRSWDTGSGSLLWESMMYTGARPRSPRDDLFDSWSGLDSVMVEYRGEKSIVVLAANIVKSFSLQDGSENWSYQSQDETVDLYALVNVRELVQVVGIQNEKSIIAQSLTVNKGTLKSSQAVPAPWLALESPSCLFVKTNVLCTDLSTLSFHVLQLESTNIEKLIDIPLTSFSADAATSSKLKLQSLGSHTNSWTSRTEFILHISDTHHLLFNMHSDTTFKLLKEYHDSSVFSGTILNDKAVLVSLTMDHTLLDLHCLDLETGNELADLSQKVRLDDHHHGVPESFVVYLFSKKDQNIGYRVFLLTSDHAMCLIQQPGRIMWAREEALAGIGAVDVVELPFSPSQANFDTLQEEFGSNPTDDVLSMFIRRIRAQAKQFQALVKQFQAFVNAQQGRAPAPDQTSTEEEQLTRDQFNLHKLILTVTDSGKMFGLDSLDGTILWQYFLPDLAPFSNDGKKFYLLYTQRTVAHFPLPAQCVVLGQSRKTGGTVLHVFNPINGKPQEDSSPQGKLLPFKVTQAMLLPQIDSKHAKLLLLLDVEKNVHVFPDTEEANEMISKQIGSLFFYLINKESGEVKGYLPQETESTLHAHEMWNVQIPPNQQKITTIGIKSPAEHVHSQGKVLGDRRVLYRYLNPNLISVGTEAVTDSKTSVSIYLVDVVTGLVVYTNRHKNARGPIHMVHSENWVVYSLYNTKSRRHELVVMEMYEGHKERNSTAFSSMDPPAQPMILQQSYIFPTAIRSMAVTITERGVTHKNLLIGLESGYVLSLAKNFLDPRRTFNPTQEDREEGLYPYMPEIVLNPLAFINYNQTVTHIREIHTSASGLESTCLVFTYGLDLFWIRVTPSRMFDVLKEDFDYWLIAGTLLILVLVTVISNRLASMKMLRQAWQ